MRRIREIIESTTEPTTTDCIWIKGNKAMYLTNGQWTYIGESSEGREELEKKIDELDKEVGAMSSQVATLTSKINQNSDNITSATEAASEALTTAQEAKTASDNANKIATDVSTKITELEHKVDGISYEITKASASGTNTTPVYIPQGTNLKIHFDRSGDSYTAYYKFFNASGIAFVNAGISVDDVELTLSDTAVSFYTFVTDEHTSPLIVTIDDDGGLQGRIEELSVDVVQALESADKAQSKVDEVSKNIDRVSAERTFAITQGTDLNTTSVSNHCLINIPANTKFRAKIDYPNGTENDAYNIYFYDGSTLKKSIKIINGDDAEFLADFKITGVAFVIKAAQSIASGNATVSVYYGKISFELEKKADNVIESVNLFNSNDPDNIIGKSINGAGAFIDNPYYFVSHPIKIEPGQSLTLNDLPSGTLFCTYYDKEGHYKANYSTNAVGVAILTNTEIEALWCRFTGMLNNKDNGYYMVNYGSTSLPYQPYKDTTILRRTNILQTTGESKDATMSQDAITKELAIAKEGTEQIVQQKIVDIPVKSSIEYAVTAGQKLNTTSAVNRFYVDMPSGYIVRVKVNYPQGNNVGNVFFYDVEGHYVSKSYNKNDEWMEFLFDVDYKSIGIYISAADAVADGTAQVSVQSYGRLTQLENTVERELSLKGKLRLADVLYHWMNGEKFPIGFHGDSTTDGVSTTGWTTENSHPAQDDAEGGRGKVDYVCELAYPKQLQNLLRSELGNNTLRIYNIGYYGASFNNNWNQLDEIYSGVYSDVKMVGIVLGINDRGSYNTPADFYAGVKDWLIKYVEYFFSKGIIPFMVTNQVVTQCGLNPNNLSYSQMYEDYLQTLCNKAKEEVARHYGLEVIDMNNFGRLILESGSYAYENITEGLHFKDLGHKLEAGFLFSQIIPWVNRTDDAKGIYFGFNCAKSRTNFQVSRYKTDVNDKFKFQLNTTQTSATDTLLFDAYMFNNSKNGAYSVKYLTPVASGYIVVDGDTANPIQITATEMNLGTWDIGLHHIQVYTGASTTVAFKGFLLESVS